MKNRGRLNRGIASVLSAALLVGMSPAIPDICLKSYAETVTDTDTAAPSVQAYADKATLMDVIFAPDSDEKNATVGLLYFGKDSDGIVQKWYILGKDEGVSGDNIAIFAASNITNNCFYKDTSNHDYAGDDDEAYVTEDETPSNVCANHYGESGIREALRKMAGEEADTSEGKVYDKYFTDTEKKMMQKTKVLTHEYSNNHLYTTNDKLYLASGDYNTNKIINVGSVSKSEESHAAADEYTSIKLSWENYWKDETYNWFWLRSPYSYYGLYALIAYLFDGYISIVDVDNDGTGVRPASNLNLSSVLFASAADAPSGDEEVHGGTITTSGADQAAMILCLDGSDENIGTFTYNEHGITVTKGTTGSTTAGTTSGTAKDIFLVVQGKTAEESGTDCTDWYYSKKITAAEDTVYFNDIAAKAGIDISKIDLTSENCKIWLETPVSDAAKLCYAVDKTTKAGTQVQDEHIWVKSYDDVTDKGSLDKYLVDEAGTKNPSHEPNSDGTHSKVTKYYVYCKVCGETDKSQTPFTHKEGSEAHKYTDEHDGYTSLPKKHYKECTVCGYISNEGKHEYDNDNDRDCNVCGYERGHNHFPLVHVEGVEPTCTEDGNIDYYHCGNGCDFISKDSIGLLPITRAETVLKATGHKAAGYKSDSSKHWKICENEYDGEACGWIFAERTHTFSGNKCTVCGYTRRSAAHNSERYNTDSGSSSDSSSGVSSTIINNITGTTVGNGSTAGWSKDASGRWWYYDAQHGKSLGWIYDKTAGKWYYTDADKGMLTGWIHDTVDGYWYYLDANTGEMLTGWQLINGKQYYFAPAPQAATYTFDASSNKWVYSNAANNRPYGSMYANTITPDNQRVDADGVRIQ